MVDEPTNNRHPDASARDGVPAHPERAQDWIDEVTRQGTPPDYSPPATPGQRTSLPPATQTPQAPGGQSRETPGDPTSQTPDAQPPRPNVHVVNTSSGHGDGVNKCPRCGSSDIQLLVATGMLMCNYCRYQWQEAGLEATFGFDSPIDQLQGLNMGSGFSNIQADAASVLTLKCQACGAEVVVNTDEAMQSRCHWCRNILSINQQIPNGAVPDGVLPFSITQEDAVARISEFVSKRKFYAHPQFTANFRPSEVVGVYLPYVTVDANAHMELGGTGEVQTRSYLVKRGNTEVQVYDANVYEVERNFDLQVDDIMMESSAQRADQDTSRNTNNIINTILPFDVKNAVTYNANYLRGFTSERRDLDLQAMSMDAFQRVMSIGRQQVHSVTEQYDRGIRWESEQLQVKGTRWVTLYLPVWLYSYYQDLGNGEGLVHYVAVNGRTGETMGSIPIRKGRLLLVSTVIGVVGTVLGALAAGMIVFN